MKIGIPFEHNYFESRVALTPYAVSTLRRRGNEIYITADAGLKSGYSNDTYKKAGAIILTSNKAVFEHSDLIVKVLAPDETEIKYLNENKILMSFLNLFNNPNLFFDLIDTKSTIISYEEIKKGKYNPILSSMSKLAGKLCFSIGTELLSKPACGKGVLLGGSASASRSKVVVIGGGNAGIEFISLANNAGSRVSVFDNDIDKLNYISSHFSGVETFYPYHDLLMKQIRNADLIIGATFNSKKKVTKLISKEMVKMIEPNSVIIDLTTERGGVFETSHVTNLGDPSYMEEGVFHYCVPNIPACVPKTASNALSTNILPYVLHITEGYYNKSSQLKEATLINKGIPIEYLEKTIKKKEQNIDLEKLLNSQEEESWQNISNIEDSFNSQENYDSLKDFEDFDNLDNPNEPED